MLPNVAAKDRFAFGAGNGFSHDRIILVGGRNHLKLSVVQDEPGPAAAEAAHAGGFEFFLERLEAAERSFDGVGHFAAGLAARLGADHFPEHGMIEMAAAVVANGAANISRHAIEISDEV